MAVFEPVETVLDIPTVSAAVVGHARASVQYSLHFSLHMKFLVEIRGLSKAKAVIEVWRQTGGCYGI